MSAEKFGNQENNSNQNTKMWKWKKIDGGHLMKMMTDNTVKEELDSLKRECDALKQDKLALQKEKEDREDKKHLKIAKRLRKAGRDQVDLLEDIFGLGEELTYLGVTMIVTGHEGCQTYCWGQSMVDDGRCWHTSYRGQECYPNPLLSVEYFTNGKFETREFQYYELDILLISQGYDAIDYKY